MKKHTSKFIGFVAAMLATCVAGAAPFTPGNIVVSRVGTGATLSSAATAIFLEEYTPTGTLVQTIPMPTAVSGAHAPLTVQGTATTEGIVTRSQDGAFLVLGGYGTVPGTAAPSGVASATINRVVGLVDSQGNIDTTTKLSNAYSSGSFRGAATADGNQFWMTGGNEGIRTAAFGATTSSLVSTTVTNTRVAGAFGSQLYVSSASGSNVGVNAVGTGLPTTSGNAATLIASASSNASQFVLLDLNAGVAGLDTIYVANSAAVLKFTFNGATWTAAGSATSANGNVIGLAAVSNGSTVSLYGATGTAFVRMTDSNPTGALTGAFGNPVLAATGTAFRGVALAPASGAVSTPPTGSGTATPNTVALSGTTLLTVSVIAGANPASTGITVTANLSGIGGSSSQALNDTGTNGDLTAGDKIFSFSTAVASGTGSLALPVTVADAQSRSSSTSIALTISAGGGVTKISAIQGTTDTPAAGTFTVEGTVTGVFTPGLSGFFVQEEDGDNDIDPLTSEGIFVDSTDSVAIGQKVRVQGTISNLYNLTRFASGATVTVLSSGNPLPAAVTPAFPFAPANAGTLYLERFEGMRVTFPTRLFVTDQYNLERFGELFLSPLTQIFNPTELVDPNDAPASGVNSAGAGNVASVTATQALNDRYRIMLDDGRNGQNGSPIPFLRPSAVGGGKTLRLGDSTAGLTGVLSYDFGEFRVQATAPVTFDETNPRQAAPPNVGGNVRVAGTNVLNYFITFGGATDRGADNNTEFVRQKAKIVAGLKALNAGVVALSELQNNGTGGGSAFNDLVSSPTGLNAAMTAAGLPTYTIIATPSTPLGTDAIQVGLMYQPSLVTPVGVALTDTVNFATYSRPPLAQLFSVNATGGKFWVIANHFKSKGPTSATGADVDQNDGQGAYNFRRKNQAAALISFINTTLAPVDPDVLVTGDLNAYGQEDPIDLFRAAGFVDLIAAANTAEAPYSYLFDGQLGRLDHALATPSLAARLTGAIEWHINAAEPRAIDYDLSFKTDDQFVANLYRYSDHDPLLVGLDVPAAALLLTPNYGRPGTTVVINGANLGTTSAVTFTGGTNAVFAINSSSQITVTVPATAQSGPIQVATGAGVIATDAFRLLPRITSFAPSLSAVGTEVTITGTDLLHVTAVKFANNQNAAFIIDSNTQIRATVPAGAVRGSIRVESPGGAATSLNRFTVTP